jgi:hypothetical protein
MFSTVSAIRSAAEMSVVDGFRYSERAHGAERARRGSKAAASRRVSLNERKPASAGEAQSALNSGWIFTHRTGVPNTDHPADPVVLLDDGVEEHERASQRDADEVGSIGSGARPLDRRGDGGAEVGERQVFQAVDIGAAVALRAALGPEVDAPHLVAGLGHVGLERGATRVIAENK